MLDGIQRRKAIIHLLETEGLPISGTEIARRFGVSRQVIVQDIALLRAENRDILSTNKGYVLFHSHKDDKSCKAIIYVKHTSEQILEEMQAIVELGGNMLNVSVDHELYGQIQIDLVIQNMDDAKDFVARAKKSPSKSLSALTDEYHYHLISAPSEKALQLIKDELKNKGYLVS